MIATGPIVATFHAATTRSKWLAAVGPMSRPWLERISGRIAVSDFARRVQVEHLGGDAVIIPNGVHVRSFAEGPSLPGHTRGVDGPTIGFLGRYDEPRKGLPVLLEAMRTVVRRHPRSEEHTSELQSRQYLVCRLLLEKKTFNTALRIKLHPVILLPASYSASARLPLDLDDSLPIFYHSHTSSLSSCHYTTYLILVSHH